MKNEPIQLSDSIVELAKQIDSMTTAKCEQLANNLLRISKFLATTELRKALLRRFDKRLSVVEKNVLGSNSIQRQWPSLSGD